MASVYTEAAGEAAYIAKRAFSFYEILEPLYHLLIPFTPSRGRNTPSAIRAS